VRHSERPPLPYSVEKLVADAAIVVAILSMRASLSGFAGFFGFYSMISLKLLPFP
jgi:hypothetical protein